MRAIFAVFSILGVSACNSLPQDAVGRQTVAGSYDAVASCVYAKLSQTDDPGVTFADLRAQNVAIVRQALQFTPIFEARFSPAGPDLVAVDIRAMQTVWGADFYARRLAPTVAGCGASR